jgi:hypothetical protein
MSTGTPSIQLPATDVVRERIAAVEDELGALRYLLRASVAAARADEARHRNQQLKQPEGRQ